MQYFNFSRLVNKYKSEFKAITLVDGYYNDSGDWVKGDKSEITIEGAIISHKDSKVYRSEGALTEKDKRLFTLTPISEALKSSKVIYNNNTYHIQDCSDNSKFTGVYAYTLKWVSAFEEGNND